MSFPIGPQRLEIAIEWPLPGNDGLDRTADD